MVYKMRKAVITSDIIQSSTMTVETRNWLIERIDNKLKTLFRGPIMESEIYRGDSFQCLIHKQRLALKTALVLKTYIKSLGLSYHETILSQKENDKSAFFAIPTFDVRMSLAVGEVEAETSRIGISNGEAFRMSGQKLYEMKKLKQSFFEPFLSKTVKFSVPKYSSILKW